MSVPVQQRAEQLHARAVDAAARGHFATASRLARRGLVAAGADSEVRARTLLTLAWAEAEQARVEVSLRLLDEAEAAAVSHPRITGLTIGQRGVLLLRLGRPQQAREEIARAIPLLAQEPVDQARALLNKGVADLECHDFAAARASFERCGQIAGELGLAALGAKAESNLGQLTGLRGDLPAALGHFQLAMERFGDAEPVLRAWTVVDSGFVLTAAGLLAEAESELLEAVPVLARAGVRLTEAEAWLALAEIALVAERLPDAQQYARRAERGFARRGSDTGALLARAVLTATAAPRGRLTTDHLSRLRSVAVELDTSGFHEESSRLRLRAARRVGRSGRYDQAAELLGEAGAATRAHSLHTRLLARTVRAEVAQGTGDTATVSREVRRGLADLQRHQSRLGSIDLQTSVVRHGSDLARMGLRLAVDSRRPAAVLTWLERTRALTTRIPPILPPEDQVMADLLGALRHQRLELRQLELDRQSTPESIATLRESCRRLERAAAAREHQLIGSGDVIAEVTTAEVRSALADPGADRAPGVLVSVFDVDGQVHALVLTPDAAELVLLGRLAPVEDQIQRVRADLDVLALDSTPPMMRTIVRASLDSGLTRLDAALWQPIAPLSGAGPVSLIPTGRLTTLPWTMLPGLRGRPITVARSPGEWLRGRQWPAPGDRQRAPGLDRGGGQGRGRAIFATGPRVERASEEIASAAAAWPEAELMPLATPNALLDRVAGADLVHIAAHGTHDADNPLFSALELTDGLLFGHDLTRVRPAPRHVVLSACDLGLATARAGSESLGMTAALLHGGTASVISGVARVADGVACDVAVAYHRRLSTGERPSYALAAALADTGADGSGASPAPLTCFGSGW